MECFKNLTPSRHHFYVTCYFREVVNHPSTKHTIISTPLSTHSAQKEGGAVQVEILWLLLRRLPEDTSLADTRLNQEQKFNYWEMF